MDDVIFAGAQDRPARNSAEVTLFIDNSARRAPAEFNDADVLEVTRRIEREAGLRLRVNGKDVRARDIRLLFEDAATGARSPALVQQGRIGEIVNAAPQERRRVLEDAAGIAGLHSRRHEAELRLKATESNLARLADLIGQLNSQIAGDYAVRPARRSATATSRQSPRDGSPALSSAMGGGLRPGRAGRSGLPGRTCRRGARRPRPRAEALRQQAEAAEKLQPLRDEEAPRAAVLHRLSVERDALEREEARAKARQAELETRLAQASRDLAREEEHIAEAESMLARAWRGEPHARGGKRARPRRSRSSATAAANGGSDARRGRAGPAPGDNGACRGARRARSPRPRKDTSLRAVSPSSKRKRTRSRQELAKLEAESGSEAKLAELNAEAAELAALVEDDGGRAARRPRQTRSRPAPMKRGCGRWPLADAKLARQEIETELATLIKLLAPPMTGRRSSRRCGSMAATSRRSAPRSATISMRRREETAPAHWRMMARSGRRSGAARRRHPAQPLRRQARMRCRAVSGRSVWSSARPRPGPASAL